jgi:hypothetical protein
MSTTNILFNPRVRKKRKHFLNSLFFAPYYKSEKYSLKEKLYTFHYNMHKTGLTTNGELQWAERLMKLDFDAYEKISDQFKYDYIQFINFKEY